jgi:hypothetical protein
MVALAPLKRHIGPKPFANATVCRVDRVDHTQRTIDLGCRLHGRRDLGFRQIDVFPHRACGARRATAGGLGDNIAPDVVDVMRAAGATRRLRPDRELFLRVVGIGPGRRTDGGRRETVTVVVDVGFRHARAAVAGQVAAVVISEAAHRGRTARDGHDTVVAGIAKHVGHSRAANRRRDLRRPVADTVVVEHLRAPRPVRVLHPVRGVGVERLVKRRRDVVVDVREIERVRARVRSIQDRRRAIVHAQCIKGVL